MDELKQMMLNIQNEQNKESESYLNVSLIPTDHSQRQRVPRRVIRTKTRNRGNGDKKTYTRYRSENTTVTETINKKPLRFPTDTRPN